MSHIRHESEVLRFDILALKKPYKCKLMQVKMKINRGHNCVGLRVTPVEKPLVYHISIVYDYGKFNICIQNGKAENDNIELNRDI